MKGRKPNASGGLAYMLGEPTYADGGRTGFRRGTSGAPGGGDPGMTSDPSGRGQTFGGQRDDRGGNVPPSMRGGAPDALWTPPVVTRDRDPQTRDHHPPTTPFTYHHLTGKKMTPADVQAEKRFKQLFKSKGYYDTSTATEEEEAIYDAYRKAIGTDVNNPMIINSRDELRTRSIDGKVSEFYNRNASFEDLVTGDITKLSNVETPTFSNERFVNPQGIWENDEYIPLRAPQSWAVQPGNLNRYSRARGGLAGLLGE